MKTVLSVVAALVVVFALFAFASSGGHSAHHSETFIFSRGFDGFRPFRGFSFFHWGRR
jgi:hypothetical protein